MRRYPPGNGEGRIHEEQIHDQNDGACRIDWHAWANRRASLSGAKCARRAGQNKAKCDRRRLEARSCHRRHGRAGFRSHETSRNWRRHKTDFGRRHSDGKFRRQRDGGAERGRRKAKSIGPRAQQGHERRHHLFESEMRRRRLRRQGNEAVARLLLPARRKQTRACAGLKSQPGVRSRPPDRWEG